MVVNRRNIIDQTEYMFINIFSIAPILINENYKYLKIVEIVAYADSMKKVTIPVQYFCRLREIWNLELPAFNKTTCHKFLSV